MITVTEGGDDALHRGSLQCPRCHGTLKPWGFARTRLVRNGGTTQQVRPRRARCNSCARTQVLLPCHLLRRRRDSVADVGTVLEAYARHTGYRRAARDLAIPVPTARNWVRGLRDRWHRLRIAVVAGPVSSHRPQRDDPFATVAAIQRAADTAGWSSKRWDFASLRTNGEVLVANTT